MYPSALVELAALEFVALEKDVIDDIGVSLDRLLKSQVHTKAQLYVAGYPCLEILKSCGHCVSDEVDVIAGCLTHELRSVREILGEYEPRQVIQDGSAQLGLAY